MAFATAAAGLTVLALLPTERLLDLPVFSWWDKAQHALAFAVLAVLAGVAWPQHPTWRWGMALLCYGFLIELAQFATGWRHGELQDALADAVGVLTGMAGIFVWRRSI